MESQNIVGYNGSALDEDYGAVLTGPQFISTGGGAFNLADLKLVSSADLAGNVEIQTLNNWGGTGDEDYLWDGSKWIDGDGNPVSDITFAPGKGLWVYNYSGEAVTFQTAGQVNESDVTYPLDTDYGAVAVVNPFPTDVALADITFITSADTAGNIEIQTLNNWGGTGDEDYLWDGSKWIDGDGNPVSNVTFAPGKGLWVYNYSGEAVGFNIPAPEL